MGARISDMRLAGTAIDPAKTYKVAGWAPVAEEAKTAGNKPVWDVVEQWLKAKGPRCAAPHQHAAADRRAGNPRLA